MRHRDLTRSVLALAAILTAFAAVSLVGCRTEPQAAAVPTAPPGLWDGLVAEGGLVVPGRRWAPYENDLWSFQNRASLQFWWNDTGGGSIGEGSPDEANSAVAIRLVPSEAASGQHFRIFWDGEELPAESLERGEDGFLFRLGDRLSPNQRHQLTFRRHYAPETISSRRNLKSTFLRIEILEGEKTRELDLADLPKLQKVAGFLEHGVIGDGIEERGGLLVLGGGRRELSWSRTVPSTLHVEPRNFADQTASFTVTVGTQKDTVEIPAGEHRQLTTAIPAGDEPVVLTVEGDAGGIYLWGMPRLSNSASRDLVPVILITLDTTRRDALSPYNGRVDLTPNLQRLADEGTVYESAFSTSPWTLPSHASMMTGFYPSRHGAGTHDVTLGTEAVTLAGLLREAGYLTVGFSSGELSSSRFGLAQGFHRYRNPDRFETLGGDLDGYLEDLLNEHGEEPLFLFINYFDPHALYIAPEEFQERLGVEPLREKLLERPVWGDLAREEMSAWQAAIDGEAPVDDDVTAFLTAAYEAEIAWTDELFGRLIERLKRLDIYERALIVVTSDHGELLGEDGYVSHGARLDPELVEIPLLIKWPGSKRSSRSSRLVSLIDLFPTVLEAVGLEAPPTDGLTLASEDDGKGHPYVLFEEHVSLIHPLPGFMEIAPHVFGVQRLTDRRLVWEDGEQCARRQDGVWRETSCADESATREDVLEAIRRDLAPPSYVPEAGEEVSAEVRRRLEALGYMGFKSEKK